MAKKEKPNPPRGMVAIQHKDVEGYGYVLPSSVAIWADNGWTVVDDGSSETDSASSVPASGTKE